MLVIIDNYDSFTYNLVQYFSELGAAIKVFRNDELTPNELSANKPDAIVISAGPCTPNEAGISMDVTKQLAQDYPIFGVCLGMQSMVQAYGGKIVVAQEIMHGKLVRVHHRGDDLFSGMDNPFVATRYNSLAADPAVLPACFDVIAWSYVGDEAVMVEQADAQTRKNEGDQLSEQNYDPNKCEIMGVRHNNLPMTGVQFHPESILTKQGKQILQNFLTAHKLG